MLLSVSLTWSPLHLRWAGLGHLWWRNSLDCSPLGRNKSWGSSPSGGGRCLWITWWTMPPCCAKYPASAGSVTCALPPALLLHGAYLEPSFSSSNFNRINFLNTGQSHITAQLKSLESTKRMNFTHLFQSLYEDNCKELETKQFWLWRKKPETEIQGLLEKRSYGRWLCSWRDKETAVLPDTRSDY